MIAPATLVVDVPLAIVIEPVSAVTSTVPAPPVVMLAFCITLSPLRTIAPAVLETVALTVSAPTVVTQMSSPATPAVMLTPLEPPASETIDRSPETSRTLMSPVAVLAARLSAAISSLVPLAIPWPACRSISLAVISAVVGLSRRSPSRIWPPPFAVVARVTRAVPAWTLMTVMSPAAVCEAWTVKFPSVVTTLVSVNPFASFTVSAAPLPVIKAVNELITVLTMVLPPAAPLVKLRSSATSGPRSRPAKSRMSKSPRNRRSPVPTLRPASGSVSLPPTPNARIASRARLSPLDSEKTPTAVPTSMSPPVTRRIADAAFGPPTITDPAAAVRLPWKFKKISPPASLTRACVN